MRELRRLLSRHAAAAERRVSLEEALVGGRFARYAARRMSWVALMRGLGTGTHILEFTILLALFSRRGLTTSVVAQNLSLLLDGAWWGALEVMRRRVRTLDDKSEIWRESSLWMAWAVRIAAACLVAGGVVVATRVARYHRPPTVLDLYLLVCALRAAADVVARTLYSGIWAQQRIFRPFYSMAIGDPLGLVVIAATWRWLGAWSFPVGLALTVVAARALVVVYTLRAYRAARLPAPRLRWSPPRRGNAPPVRLGEVLWAAAGNLSSRIGATVALATMIRKPFDNVFSDPFPYVAQLAVPLVTASSSWARVFYHDFKRLESELAARLMRRLQRRLIVVAVGWALLLGGALAGIVIGFVGVFAVRQALFALGPVILSLSILAALQLGALARGAFVRLFLGSTAACLSLVGALWMGAAASDVTVGLYAGCAITVGVVVLSVGAAAREPAAAGALPTLHAWLRALRRVDAAVRVGGLRLEGGARLGQLAGDRIAALLADSGAVVVLARGARLLWFERAPHAIDAVALARATSGLARTPRLTAVAADGRAAIAAAVAAGLLAAPVAAAADGPALVAEFRTRFPDGIIAALDGGPADGVAALPPRLRQLLWLDACARAHDRRVRLRTPFDVTSYRPRGEIHIVFAVPRSRSADERSAWRAHVEAVNWRAAALDGTAGFPV